MPHLTVCSSLLQAPNVSAAVEIVSGLEKIMGGGNAVETKPKMPGL